MAQDQNIDNEVRAMVAEILEREPDEVDPDRHLLKELGADSMMVLEFMASLETRYGVVIKPDRFPQLITVNKAAALIRGLLDEKAAA